ncbi:hypothetical protein [Symmachiella dynata]|uniref:hypothetical protein n=1 Tax=Symmachiella dynata TaxID=2527995 RepID=UPI0030ECA759
MIANYPNDDFQRGYFYYSENTVGDETDDVLQFTIATRQASAAGVGASDDDTFYGKAVYIQDPIPSEPEMMIDQPVADDGSLDWDTTNTRLEISLPPNELATGNIAEVCYFLRNGNLYRRTVLVRTPLVNDASLAPNNLTASVTVGGNQGYGGNSDDPLTANFYTDFDFSAFHDPRPLPGDPSDDKMAFLEVDLNSPTTGAWVNDTAISLGIPKFRFGFFGDVADPTTPGGPIEFLDNTMGNPVFIGRFTHAETSDIDFGYPGRIVDTSDNAFNPYTDTIFDETRGVITEAAAATFDLANGPRIAEDIVLSNVHSFDIKIFDDITEEFEDLGHSNVSSVGTDGRYHTNNNANPSYGNRYDTWHANSSYIGNNVTPYRPATVGPDGQPGDQGVDDDGNGTPDDNSELGWPGTDDVLIPLRAIKITIRYLDTTSNQMRDLTIIHSFADRDNK